MHKMELHNIQDLVGKMRCKLSNKSNLIMLSHSPVSRGWALRAAFPSRSTSARMQAAALVRDSDT